MQAGFFEKQIVLTPDLCGSAAALSPLAAFTIFQGIASEHAERIGVGGAAMAKRGEFWLTVHSRVDFYESAYLMDELTARTWPEQCEGRDIRCFRSYRLTKGEQTVALGRTQWAILGPEQKILRFEQSGFPADFPFPATAAICRAARALPRRADAGRAYLHAPRPRDGYRHGAAYEQRRLYPPPARLPAGKGACLRQDQKH